MINLANLRDTHLGQAGQARPGQAESGLKGLDKTVYCLVTVRSCVQVSVQVSLLMIIEAGDMSAAKLLLMLSHNSMRAPRKQTTLLARQVLPTKGCS